MNNRLLVIFLSLAATIYGCSTTQTATKSEEAPSQEKKTKPINFESLQEPPEDWHHLNEQYDRFRGTGSQRAYETILSDKKPLQKVIVAVIDGGIDINHEDLNEVIWVNEDEIPNNQKDDDNNGYVDDVHGWNFIGGTKGRNVEHDTFELTRIYRKLQPKFANVDTTSLSKKELEQYEYFKKIRTDYENEIKKLNQQFSNIQSLEQSIQQADQILDHYFADSTYTYEDIQELKPTNQQLSFAKNVMSYVMENNIDSTLIANQKKQIYELAKYGYNPDFHTRHIVGDDYKNKNECCYGNNDVAGPDPSHGTHVAGIIAAERNNGIGVNGIATNTRIMAIRAVPNGDERDKDVANAIRYAVDNGADIINMSFGKSYSPHKEVVDRAIAYADKHNVLMVHGAGNSAKNTDEHPSFPTDALDIPSADSAATLWLSVGATSWKPNDEFIASFSNYGDRTVDLFAPGVDIYSTMPDNKYKRQDGTSMASPVVAGTAALIMAYYPALSPQQVREIILNSTTKYPEQKVLVPNTENPEPSKVAPFSKLSASDGVVNVYNAIQAAEKMSKKE